MFFFSSVSIPLANFESNKSTLTDKMTIGLLGFFHTCDEETHPESSVLFDEADYLCSILTFALINFFVTGGKSYLSTFANGIGPLSQTCFIIILVMFKLNTGIKI